MAPRIIKQGTARASSVQQFLFSENSVDLPLPNDQSLWPELPSVPALPPAPPSLEVPLTPGVDLAQLEKTAYENGFLQGEKAGLEIAEKKVEAVMRRYSDAIFEVSKLRSFLYAQVEREVVKLAVEVAKKIIHREINADPEIIQTLVRVALGHVAEKSAVTIHLNPADYSYLLGQRAELSQAEGRDIALLADKSIERGGCLIQTECGDIDARIEEKFREVEHAFFEGLK
jgi:flagellar biosynthesis/type III secretory pathway protein FliH